MMMNKWFSSTTNNNFFQKRKDMPVNLFIVEDNPMYNFFLKYTVSENYQFKVFDYGSFEECIADNAHTPDIILLDYELPHINGIQSIPLMRRLWPAVEIIVISSKVNDEAAQKLAAMDVRFCVAKKDASVEEINKVIDETVAKLKRKK